jgi:hypothetical protein
MKTPWPIVPLLAGFLASIDSAYADPDKKPYVSPYSVKFTVPEKERIGDLLDTDRGDPKLHSRLAHEDWYSPETRKKWGAWGVPFKKFDPPEGFEKRSIAWKRERVIAIGMRYQGYSYQHHHLPDWDPLADWPWKPVARGHNAKGVDCSNLTGWVYNLGLGIHFTTAIKPQSEQLETRFRDRTLTFTRIEKPKTHADCKKEFRTGDLLFIKNKSGEVSHVVLWVGDIGVSGDETPLILDSTGDSHKDRNGESIPDGVNLRPFAEKGWYFQSLSHAHRVIGE